MNFKTKIVVFLAMVALIAVQVSANWYMRFPECMDKPESACVACCTKLFQQDLANIEAGKYEADECLCHAPNWFVLKRANAKRQNKKTV